MPTQFPDLFAALAAPFPPGVVKQRAGGGGRTLSYITSRTVMNRLDEMVGPENWRNAFREVKLADGADAVVCTIEIRHPETGEWIGKQDAGGFKEMEQRNRAGETETDEENTAKTGYSDSFKRAAVMWGIGRYLYRDGVPGFAGDAAPTPPADHRADPPREPRGQGGGQGHGSGNGRQYDGPPRSGKALFAWTKEMEQRHEVGLLKYLNNWAKLQDFPGRMIDWDAEQVALAHAEAVRKLESVSVTGEGA